MSNLTRTTPRPAIRTGAAASKTKVLLVRQPVKSVRKSDEADRAALKLAIGVVTALGIVGGVWLMGYLGYRLGFADLVRVGELQLDVGGGLAVGTMMLISIPRVIVQAGVANPELLMVGFAAIAIPAASLGGIKPSAPGGPRPKPAVVILSFAGAAFAVVNSLILIGWTVSPFRNNHVRELPVAPEEAMQWLADLQLVGGLDVLGAIAASLWVVVAMRLTIPLWLRGLSASACFFALVVVAVAMSMSNATVAQLTTERSVVFLDDNSLEPRLLLGHTAHSIAALNIRGSRSFVELRDRPEVLEVIGRQSIIEYLDERKPRIE